MATIGTEVERSLLVEVRRYLFIYFIYLFTNLSIYLFIYLFIYSLIHQLMKDCPFYQGLFSLQGGVKMNHSLS